MIGDVEPFTRTFPKSVQPGIPKLKPPKAGWRTIRFGDVLTQVVRPVKMKDKSEYRLVTVKRSRGGLEERSRLKGGQISVKSQFELAGGDFLISKRQIVHGACAIVSEKFSGAIVSNEYSVLRCAPELDLNFLGYMAHSLYFQQTCFHSSIGVHVEKMIFKLEDWFGWPIQIPTLPEQQKIVAFLGAVDDRLAGLRRTEAALVQFKAGMMQRLFSQELRFTQDDGSSFPDWEVKRLGDVGSFRGGGTPDTSSEVFWNGTIPWISSQDTSEDSIAAPRISRWIGEDAIKASATQRVPAGSILVVSRVGVGKIAVAPMERCTSQDFSSITIHSGDTSFMAYALLTAKMKLLALAQGTSIKGIAVTELRQLCVPYPHPDEQRKIAAALSSLDVKITATRAQITKTEEFKAGLLQQMFV